MLLSLKNFRAPWAKNLFWLFCIFFGFTLVSSGGTDSYTYGLRLIEFADSDFTFRKLIQSLYSQDTSYVDVLQPLLTFLVSRVTDNPKILFACFGLIFGYFYSRNIWYVLDRVNGIIYPSIFFLLLSFSLFIPIWNINGFRMYTAAHIFIFGAMPYLLEGKKKNLLWSVSSVFVHFSFVFPIVILFSYILLKERLSLLFWFFIITSFVSELDLQAVRDMFSNLPDVFQPRVESYTNQDYAISIQESINSAAWYIQYYIKFIKWSVYLIAIVIYFKSRKFLKSNKDLSSLFGFAMYIFGWANIAENIPSGRRFIAIANIFMFAFFIFFFLKNQHDAIYKKLLIMITPMLMLFIVVSIRVGMDYFGILTIGGNPLIAPFFSENVALIVYIKMLF